MVVCPHCAHPYVGEVRVISTRDITCSRCGWSGSSERLLIIDDDSILDPLVFDKLYAFLHKEIAPIVGRTLIQLKLASGSPSPENLKFLVEILKAYTTAGFEALVKEVLAGMNDGRA